MNENTIHILELSKIHCLLIGKEIFEFNMSQTRADKDLFQASRTLTSLTNLKTELNSGSLYNFLDYEKTSVAAMSNFSSFLIQFFQLNEQKWRLNNIIDEDILRLFYLPLKDLRNFICHDKSIKKLKNTQFYSFAEAPSHYEALRIVMTTMYLPYFIKGRDNYIELKKDWPNLPWPYVSNWKSIYPISKKSMREHLVGNFPLKINSKQSLRKTYDFDYTVSLPEIFGAYNNVKRGSTIDDFVGLFIENSQIDKKENGLLTLRYTDKNSPQKLRYNV